jgi:pSer/pThr/pTyr-binding forkhead associated (FHA) protein
MPVHLEVVEGPAKGRKIPLDLGKTVSIGRTELSMVIVPEDETMSGQHFSVGLKNGSVLVCNLSQTNGTSVDGKKINAEFLKPGQKFKAGLTTFEIVSPVANPHEAKLRIGGWGFKNLPEGWEIAEGEGLRHPMKEPFRANMSAVEEPLPKGHTLKSYVELQIQLGQQHLKASVLKEPVEAKIAGADEALALSMTAHVEGKGKAVQNQVYALHSGVVGVFTATALETQAQLMRDAMAKVLKGLSFFQV